MRWIDMGFLILMATLTGSIAFGLWKVESRILERQGRIRGVRMGLILTIMFFWLPVVFLFLPKCIKIVRGMNEEIFLAKMSALELSAAFLVLVWAGGMLIAAAEYIVKKRKLSVLLESGRTAGEEIQETAEQIRNNLHIRKRISVCVAEGLSGPFIVGLLKCRIFLPDKVYKAEELQIILEHELWHYKQGDLFLKSLCICLSWIEWFNPLIKKFSAEVDKWGDIHCDLRMCYGREKPWSRRQYFMTVLDNVPEEEGGICMGMQLKTNKDELKERMKKMKSYRPEKELKRFALVFLMLCFVLAVTVTSSAAGVGVEALYDAAYKAAEGKKEKNSWIQPQGDICEENSQTYVWTLSADESKEAEEFYAEEGSRAAVLISPDISGALTEIGFCLPDGSLSGIFGKGVYSHTLSVQESGKYKVYVRNRAREDIMVSVTVLLSP